MKKITDLTPEEAQDELVLMGIEKLIRRAKRAADKSRQATAEVFEALDNMCIDLDTPSEAENAEILGDAVSCYIDYGEFGLSNVMREIRAAYQKEAQL